MCSANELQLGWYLLKTKNREELRAQENLEALGFEAYCPEIFGKSTKAPLFPGYLFIRLGVEGEPPYHQIRSTRGVLHMVRFNRINHRLYESGQLANEKLHTLLPSPIPNGDDIIQQIEAFTWQKNGAKPEDKPDYLKFQPGETVLLDHSLYNSLEKTFIKGINMDRGLVLMQYIESRRNADGTTERIVTREMEVTVPLKDLRKTAENA